MTDAQEADQDSQTEELKFNLTHTTNFGELLKSSAKKRKRTPSREIESQHNYEEEEAQYYNLDSFKFNDDVKKLKLNNETKEEAKEEDVIDPLFNL